MLGMTKGQIFYHVTLLQVIKRIVPPIGNEIITLIKDTSLANFIMVKEVIAMAKEFGNKAMIWPLFYAGVFFLVFNGLVTFLLSRTEKKPVSYTHLDVYKRQRWTCSMCCGWG